MIPKVTSVTPGPTHGALVSVRPQLCDSLVGKSASSRTLPCARDAQAERDTQCPCLACPHTARIRVS